MYASSFSPKDFDVLQQLIDPDAIPNFVAANAKAAVHTCAKREAQFAPASSEQATSDAPQHVKRLQPANHILDMTS